MVQQISKKDPRVALLGFDSGPDACREVWLQITDGEITGGSIIPLCPRRMGKATAAKKWDYYIKAFRKKTLAAQKAANKTKKVKRLRTGRRRK